MSKVNYIQLDGTQQTVEATEGVTLMEAAVNNDVPGITADCGGNLACATCHVYIDGEWAARLEPPSDMETEMLEFASGLEPSSRLACQIPLTAELDGIVVRVPATQ